MNVTNDAPPDSSVNENEKSTPFNCSVCGKKFSNEKRYFGHLRIHRGEILWSCAKCPRSAATAFDSESKLMTHENLCHALVRPYKCSKCDDAFDRASQLNYHRRSVHLGEKSQICQICGKGFFRKTDLRTHLNVHLGTNQSICEICGRKFNHVSNLIRHCRTHEGSKPYPCAVCGKRFTQISSLARHKRIHSRRSNVSSAGTVEEPFATDNESLKIERKKTTKRQHYCRICGESFQFMVLLRQHERLHSKKPENRLDKSYEKNQERESSVDRLQSTEQTIEMHFSNDDHDQPRSNDWRDFHEQDEGDPDDDASKPMKNASNNSIRDHLLELDRKMNAIEIESERDANISISDILRPYDCDDIELSNADDLETKLYENSRSANRNEALEKDYDIARCLNTVNFGSNADSQLSEIANEKNLSNLSYDRCKSSSKDRKNSKSKSLVPLIGEQSDKCLRVEGNQLYIEICESEYLKNVNSDAGELQEIDNVGLIEEVFDLVDDDSAKYAKIHSRTIAVARTFKSDEKTDVRLDDDVVGSETGEHSLRLVQTETGQQFYELVINGQCTENFRDNEEMEERIIQSIESVNIDNDLQFSTGPNDSIEQPDDNEITTSESGCNEFLQMVSNADSHSHKTTQNDNSMPMVRLVQNEDGEQFFELVREQSEYERNRDDRINENTKKDDVNDIPSNAKSATRSYSKVRRDKKECIVDNVRSTKDRTRKFRCDECDKWFSTAYNFKQHAGTHFYDQQKFRCKDCGMSFAWKSTLNKHLAVNHRPDGPQKFVCKICPKVYGTLSQVNEHVKRDHLKERNHVCPDCGKSFFKKFDLKTHARIHTDERPYVCRSCGKRFHHQSHIIRHERIHSGERPYACDVCQKSFTQPSALRAHRQRHRDVKIDILEYRMDDDDPLALAMQ